MKQPIILFIVLVFSVFAYGQSNTYILAENYFRTSQYEKAADLYKDLVSKSPYNTTYLQRLVTCYQELDNFNHAETLLLTLQKRKPELAFLNVILGYNYERQQQSDIANQHYAQAIVAIKKGSNYGSIIANLFKSYNKLDLAIKAYETLLLKNKTSNYGFQIAQIYGEKGEYVSMFEAYINFVDQNDKFLSLVKRYTAKYITDDSDNENNILFRKALLRKAVRAPKNVWNDLLSWLFIKQKQYDKALLQLKALYARDANYLSEIKELGDVAYQEKAYNTAVLCFDFILNETRFPEEKFEAIYMKLLVSLATNKPEMENDFQAVFKTYGINKNTVNIQVAYANYLTFQQNNPEKANIVLEEALTHANTVYQQANIKLKLGDVLVYQNKFNKGLIYFSQVQTRLKNHVLAQEARFKVAQTSYFKNDFSWAKAQLKILKGSASQLIANDAANLFLIISDNAPKDSIPSGLSLFAKADLLAYQNKTKEALLVLDEVLVNFKGQPIEDDAYFKQAELYCKEELYEKAMVNYRAIITMGNDGILIDDVYYQMANLYKNTLNNTEKALEYYQKIIFDYPSSIYLVEARKAYRKLRGDAI